MQDGEGMVSSRAGHQAVLELFSAQRQHLCQVA